MANQDTPNSASTLPQGFAGYRCRRLDEGLADALIARTLDPGDARLREMTRDLERFSSRGQLDQWRPGRDLLCLEDEEGSLQGVLWVADKPLPERDDWREPRRVREIAPRVTCAIRTYGAARGRGLLTRAFAETALAELLRSRGALAVWYQTKAANHGARALGRQLGFFEASGEAGGTVVGIRSGGALQAGSPNGVAARAARSGNFPPR